VKEIREVREVCFASLAVTREVREVREVKENGLLRALAAGEAVTRGAPVDDALRRIAAARH
jgi:hypothetical protein